MKLSIKSQYALESLMDIGLRQAEQDRPVSIRGIAERRGIPERFLGQILTALGKAGVLVSVRGVHGGYRLARPSGDISVGEVVRALEGPLAPVACVRSGTDGGAACLRTDRCMTRGLWQAVADEIDTTLDAISLGELITCCGAVPEQEGIA